jgi:hypothetical protein
MSRTTTDLKIHWAHRTHLDLSQFREAEKLWLLIGWLWSQKWWIMHRPGNFAIKERDPGIPARNNPLEHLRLRHKVSQIS